LADSSFPRSDLSPIQPSTAQRCRSETERHILEDRFSSSLSQFKKYHPSGNPKFNNLGIFQSLKLRFFVVFFTILLGVNFTQNTLGCFGLRKNGKGTNSLRRKTREALLLCFRIFKEKSLLFCYPITSAKPKPNIIYRRQKQPLKCNVRLDVKLGISVYTFSLLRSA